MAAVLSCDHRWAGLQWFGHIVGCKIHLFRKSLVILRLIGPSVLESMQHRVIVIHAEL